MGIFHRFRSDESLALNYQAGDASAFNELYSRHKDRLYAFLVRTCPNNSIAEELAQEAWTSLINRIEHYRPEAKFTTYLFTIARRKLIDYLRQETRANTESLDDINPGDTDESALIDHTPDALKQLELSRLLHHIKQLPTEQREAFTLKEEGFSLQEIAEITQAETKTVKSRLRYARTRLRAVMTEKCHTEYKSRAHDN